MGLSLGNLNHCGHDVPTDIVSKSMYPENRLGKPTEAQQSEVLTLLELGIKTSKVIDHVRDRYDILLHRTDIVNLYRKIRAASAHGLTEDQLAIRYLKSLLAADTGDSVEILCDKHSSMSVIYLQTDGMKSTIHRNSDVLYLDATYRINIRKMPLFVFMAADGDNCGRVISLALVVNESEENVTNLLGLFVKENSAAHKLVKTVVLDKDFSEINAVKRLFPNAQIVLCKFHVDRAFYRSLSKKAADLKESVMATLRELMTCSTN